eukprot:Colp12_sorted_trinity150504_noHs@11893
MLFNQQEGDRTFTSRSDGVSKYTQFSGLESNAATAEVAATTSVRSSSFSGPSESAAPLSASAPTPSTVEAVAAMEAMDPIGSDLSGSKPRALVDMIPPCTLR